MSPRKKKDNLPLWMIVGVITGAMIMYLASNDEYIFKAKRQSPYSKESWEEKRKLSGLSSVSDAGIVLASEYEPARNNASPNSPDAPKQSDPIEKSDLPEDAILLHTDGKKFIPNSFKVALGAPVTLALKSEDETGHILMFNDESLRAVAIGLSSGEMRAITFNAPEKAGEYAFHCDMLGHKDEGETGTMIVE